MTLTIYGIPNCDTVKKARLWLEGQGVPFAFHDYKKSSIDEASLARWCAALGWEKVLNRAGTTFRKLEPSERAELDEGRAIQLMLAQPSMIKRPILEGVYQGRPILLAGFKPEMYAAALTG